MMSTRNIILAGIGLVLLLLGVFYLGSASNQKHSWQIHLNPESKDPYGTHVLVELLKNYFPQHDFVISEDMLDHRLRLEKVSVPSTLILSERQTYFDSLEVVAVKEFVAAGNTVFIYAFQFPVHLLDELLEESCNVSGYPFITRKNIFANFSSTELKNKESYLFEFKSRYGSREFGWEYFDPEETCFDSGYSVLGRFNESYINFYSVPYGKGRFLIHTSPLMFTNYHLLRSSGKEYVEKTLAYFPEGDIIWDNRPLNVVRPSGGQRISESPLAYILGEDGLRWGWYVLLSMLLLYAMFQARRRQKIIPLLEPNTNTSLEFVESIGNLYYQQQNHRNLALQKMKHFLLYIRRHYHISTQRLDKDLIKNISIKSKVPAEEVEMIFRTYNSIKTHKSIEDYFLIDFHEAIENFYRKCR
ncbi:MAG: DUF4350 domain-containing protein [Bacteroidia bacterium]